MSRRRVIITALFAVLGAAGLYVWRSPAAMWLFLTCMAATLFLSPRIARWATHKQVVALPGGRDLHLQPTPRAGGAALFVPIAVTLLVLAVMGGGKAWALLLGSALVFACGLMDDVRGVRPRTKILTQLCAGLVLLAGGFRLPELSIGGVGSLELGWLEVPATLFWVVLVSNAFNLSDGLDGLASSIAILGLAVLVTAGVSSLVPIALAGTCHGFLYYNMPRARIFLGDSGSLLLGFLLAALALELPTENNLPLAIAACAYSLGDAALAGMRRFVRGKPLFAPDSSHLHHKAVLYLGGVRRSLAVVLLFAAVQAALGVFLPGVLSLPLIGFLWLTTAMVLARLGSYQAGELLEERGPMRRLHTLQRLVTMRLSTAKRRGELEFALQNFVQVAGLCALSVDDLHVVNPDGCCAAEGHPGCVPDEVMLLGATVASDPAPRCTEQPVPLLNGQASWRARPTRRSDALARERETIVVMMVRRAHRRLCELPLEPGAPFGGGGHPAVEGAGLDLAAD